ncbi:hypothetical protein C8R44DRAFT_746439 [Mycena epipterygia]|nr:hypothetical protein C8R44DRAFT_746439 [Mycena epipterygia]
MYSLASPESFPSVCALQRGCWVQSGTVRSCRKRGENPAGDIPQACVQTEKPQSGPQKFESKAREIHPKSTEQVDSDSGSIAPRRAALRPHESAKTSIIWAKSGHTALGLHTGRGPTADNTNINTDTENEQRYHRRRASVHSFSPPFLPLSSLSPSAAAGSGGGWGARRGVGVGEKAGVRGREGGRAACGREEGEEWRAGERKKKCGAERRRYARRRRGWKEMEWKEEGEHDTERKGRDALEMRERRGEVTTETMKGGPTEREGRCGEGDRDGMEGAGRKKLGLSGENDGDGGGLRRRKGYRGRKDKGRQMERKWCVTGARGTRGEEREETQEGVCREERRRAERAVLTISYMPATRGLDSETAATVPLPSRVSSSSPSSAKAPQEPQREKPRHERQPHRPCLPSS